MKKTGPFIDLVTICEHAEKIQYLKILFGKHFMGNQGSWKGFPKEDPVGFIFNSIENSFEENKTGKED